MKRRDFFRVIGAVGAMTLVPELSIGSSAKLENLWDGNNLVMYYLNDEGEVLAGHNCRLIAADKISGSEASTPFRKNGCTQWMLTDGVRTRKGRIIAFGDPHPTCPWMMLDGIPSKGQLVHLQHMHIS